MDLNLYYPIFTKIPDNMKETFQYYEVRVWIDHNIIEQQQFKTLKMARKYYKKRELSLAEDEGSCYVEITRIKPLKKFKI